MIQKIYNSQTGPEPVSHIGATLEALASTIAERRQATESSYTHRLLTEDESVLLSKVEEEAAEVAEAAFDGDVDHLRYEAADVVYHLMVVLERHGISLDEFAAELNMRMQDSERPTGAVLLYNEYVKRGK